MAQPGTRTFRARLFAVLALVALAATYLTPIIDADWNAWRYDHGHASLTPVGQHSHPWDHPGGQGAPDGSSEDAGFVFTASSDSVPGIAAIWTPSTATAVAPLSNVLVEFKAIAPPRGEAPAPLSPPPKESLSHTSHA